ncbi:protein N-lysine methyltransferase family protein [Niveibacterium sp. 24ML]|uniref:class I SAM-dependent methyltransferase n=1 Tax=Niveibacterium sp. 24ML TaxID=2985512 RepID=UPI00226EA1A5|nr:methyltransferase domain-containing protein [Niveibacterium sp. 24ML]MCX9154939.1 protein N-lysine methyltransferase family protein [Niveibacterium sp. 24ML]
MPGYLVKLESIAITGVANIQIRSLLDREQFSDPLGEAEAMGISSAAWPLFGLVWPSGRVLAGEMAVRDLAGLRILEVGCGLAIASLIAHRRLADVTASDCHPLARSFINENLRLNGLPPMKYLTGDWATHSEALGRFDLIIGSDVLYERDERGQLAGFIQRHAAPSAEVLIVDPDRGNRPHFSRHMKHNGFTLTETRADCEHEAVAYRGRLLRYLREAPLAA